MSSFIDQINTNPLLAGLDLDPDKIAWWARLGHDPFRGVNLAAVPRGLRDQQIEQLDKLYVPTGELTTIASAIHNMLIGGLADRHPHQAAQRQAIYLMAQHAQRPTVSFTSPVSKSRGMLLEGVTKQGKTTLLSRVLGHFPRTIDRDRDELAGWAHLKQLVHLVVPMPSDASKSGFLKQAFIELDNALGTNYATTARIRNSTVDQQLVEFLSILVQHRCGLLIIEEAQYENELTNSRFGTEFHTFFLRVLNAGIPTIIVGNPMAFDDLKTNSQLMSRLSNPGQFTLAPCASPTISRWSRDLVPGIWSKSLFNEPDEPIDDLDMYLYQATGGFTHYLSVLRVESLKVALEKGASRVMREHVERAKTSPPMVVGRKIIDAYWKGQAGDVIPFVDMPGASRKRSGRR